MTGGKPTWSGRIAGGLRAAAREFLDTGWDEELIEEQDVLVSIAHARTLEAAGLLTTEEADRLVAALESLERPYDPEQHEDVHSAVELQLGELGARLHTGRSRNDLVATDLRLWARKTVLALTQAVLDLQNALLARAADTEALLAPGYTHLQRGQPVTMGHWLLAHACALDRDVVRLLAAYDMADESPLGAGALAGNTLGLDPAIPAKLLGFSRVFTNTVDAVADRDFLIDAAYAWATTAIHISRLAEEIVLWTSAEFGFARPPEGFSTGSSMMPQKRNPDVAELARAESGAAAGALVDLLVTSKGLALAYDRDLQAVKRSLRPLMRAPSAIRALAGMVLGLEFRDDRLREAVSDDFLLATDLAEALVLKGVPFRRAHERVGALAQAAEGARTGLRDALENAPHALEPLTKEEALALLDPATSVERRTTPGGPSRQSVRAQIWTLGLRSAERAQRVASLRETLPGRRGLRSYP